MSWRPRLSVETILRLTPAVLAHWDGWDDPVHQVRGALGHAPAAAARAEPPALVGERHQVLERTPLASHPGEAVG
jgi:hypothetical protein